MDDDAPLDPQLQPLPTKSRGFPRRDRPNREQRSLRVKQLAQLMARNVADDDAVNMLAAKWGIKDRRTKQHYLDAVYARWNRNERLNRESNEKRALEQRMEVIRSAWSREVVEVTDEPELDAEGKPTGKLRAVRRVVVRPDHDVILRALDSIAKIQGLMQPERFDVAAEAFDPLWRIMVDVLRLNISDQTFLAKLFRQYREAVKNRVAGTVIDARPVQSAALPIASNGTNGHHVDGSKLP